MRARIIIISVALVIMAAAMAESSTKEKTLATSQEYEVKTVEKADVTGKVNLMSVGMAAVMDTLPDIEFTFCEWADIVLTEDEMNLLYTTVYCEAGNQGHEAQVMVALVILNRLNSDKYPDTLREVIYQPNQFSVTSWPDFESRGWTSSVKDAVDYALIRNDYPRDMYYFRADYYHSFGVPYTYKAETYFSTEER